MGAKAASPLDFRAISYPVRIFSGADALDALSRELARLGVRRAFVICGRTVSRATPLVTRIRGIVGDRLAGVFDEAEQNATRLSVEAATAAARSAGCDAIVAVGAGSVMMVGRMVAIHLGESRPADDLMTRYAETGAPISARLDAPKVPIINVLTAPTNAQNRGGSAMLDETAGRRMEFFDPKTRPSAIFWDRDALMTAPASLARSSGLTVFWWSLMWLGAAACANPLVQGDRLQAFRLARAAVGRMDEPDARIEMCAASFLQNRDEDMGGRPFEAHWVSRVCYALGAGIVTVADGVKPGDAYLALTGPAITHFGARCPVELAAIATALGADVSSSSRDVIAATARTVIERLFATFGAPRRLRELVRSRGDLVQIRDAALQSYNADPQRQFVHEVERLDAVLEGAW